MRSAAVATETTWAPDGRVICLANAAPLEVEAAGEPEVEALDMRRAISAATTMKPTTIRRPMTMTSTLSQSGAAGWGRGAEEEDAKKTP